MSESMPLVSVIVPNYNHERFIEKRLESVFGQTFSDMEVILLDDCSKDASPSVLERYAGRDEVSHFIQNELNSGGPFAQWRKGMSLSRGKYIWIAESDDYSDERFLEELVSRMENDSSIGFAYCHSVAVDENDRRLFNFLQRDDYRAMGEAWDADFVMDGKSFCLKYMMSRNVVPNASSVLFRRDLGLRSGDLKESMRLAGDWNFWVSLLAESKVCFVSQELNYFRFHPSSVRESTDLLTEHQERYLVATKIQCMFDISDEALVAGFIDPILKPYLACKNSISYRIGYLLLQPLRLIQSVLSRSRK